MDDPKRFDCFDDASIKALAQTLGRSDLITGRDITALLEQAHLPNTQENATKWKRIYSSFVQFQNEENTSNNILLFIRLTLSPASFTEHIAEYQDLVGRTNKILAFSGLALQSDGKIHRVTKAGNIYDAISRAQHLKSQLMLRNVHNDILMSAENEIIYDNYFHTVLEAIKSVTIKLRNLTGYYSDGSDLVRYALLGESPNIIINNYASKSEKGEQTGLANFLIGIYGMIRNPLAHEPKTTWHMSEADAIDILCTLSYVHRKLDNARKH